MKISDLLSKNAVISLRDIHTDEVLPVTITIKPADDKQVKEQIRKALIDAPQTPAENATDAERIDYIQAMDIIERKILASRVIAVSGLEDLAQTTEAIETFIVGLPAEFIGQIQEAISDRKVFFRQFGQ